MTLSHCWGLIQITKLTQANLESFLSEIDFNSLTKSFQDAIHITRALDCQYLWIDSLCIIQDSEKDWINESAVMGRIYLHSWCTIAATAAENGRVGCLISRDARKAKPIVLSRSKHGLAHYALDVDMWFRNIVKAPLNSRAWVVQERLLSSRILHFAHDQVFWECREHAACEAFPMGLPEHSRDVFQASNTGSISHSIIGGRAVKSLNPQIEGARQRQLMGLTANDDLVQYGIWDKIIMIYTAGRLTKQSDKLVAISGIARQMKSLLKVRYLAGLWDNYVESQLLWSVDNSEREAVRPRTYHAPSWSWASVDGDVKMACAIRYSDRRDYQKDVKILSISISPAKINDEFGQISGGHIRIRGQLSYIRLVAQAERHPQVQGTNSRQSEVRFGNVKQSSHAFKINQSFVPGVRWVFDDESATRASHDLVFHGLLITSWMHEKEHADIKVEHIFKPHLEGLLLEPTGVVKGQFRRVGFFEITGYQGLQTWETRGGWHPNLEFESNEMGGVFIITIV
jgi:hypothetical protein